MTRDSAIVHRDLDKTRRMRAVPCLALAVMITAPAVARPDRPLGVETAIVNVGNGGLRNWVSGEPGSDTMFVQDRRLRWYRVALTGNCVNRPGNDTVRYTTDVTGRFDRFSKISTLRQPTRVCGVTSIRTSAPPAGQPGAHKSR